jgi:hypothetical protein
MTRNITPRNINYASLFLVPFPLPCNTMRGNGLLDPVNHFYNIISIFPGHAKWRKAMGFVTPFKNNQYILMDLAWVTGLS